MAVRNTIRQVAAYYRKSARFAVFIILLASFAIPSVLASGPGSLNLSPNVNVNAVTPFGCGFPLFPSNGYYQASGGVSASGTYSGKVFLTGSITIYGHDKATDKPETETLALNQGDFSPNPMNFPGQSQSGVDNPQVNSNFCEPVIDGYTYWVAASNQPGCTGGACVLANSTVTVSVTGGSTQMFQLVMEMPLFNETTLGTTVHCAPTTSPCGLPLQGFYDFIFIIAIILAGGGLLIALANKQYTGDERKNVLLDFVIAVLFIVLFPVIYNNIALLTNYLDMTIIAGPNLPYTDYSLQVSLVWGKLLSWAQGGGHLGAARLADNERGGLDSRSHRLPHDHLPRRHPDLADHGHGHRVPDLPRPQADSLREEAELDGRGHALRPDARVADELDSDRGGCLRPRRRSRRPRLERDHLRQHRDKRDIELGRRGCALHGRPDTHRLRAAHGHALPDRFAGGDGRGGSGRLDGGSCSSTGCRGRWRRRWRGRRGWRGGSAGQPG